MVTQWDSLIAIVSFFIGIVIGYVSQKYTICFISPLKKFLLSPRLLYYQLRANINEFLDESVYPSAIVGSIVALFVLTFLGYQSKQPYLTIGRIVVGFTGALLFGYSSASAGGCPLHLHWKAGEGDKNAWSYLLGFYLGIVYFYLFLEGLVLELIR